MPALLCVPITVEEIDQALADAALARDKAADLVEFRIDSYFHGSSGDDEQDRYALAQLQRLLAESPLPALLTCRSSEEGGDYDGDEADRVALLEKLTAASDRPPAYLDFELAAYRRSANIRQKVNLCLGRPDQRRDAPTRLILSIHDFEGRPADLTRRLADAYAEPACSVVKVAFRARSLRDNLELFDILREAPKPTIALGMGEFGLMSRVLAPKFNGLLTFASLRDEAATAPGQPTIDDLLGPYRFRSIKASTKVYGVIGWPVGHSMSPLIHNAGFEQIGFDGVYLPMPIAADEQDKEASYASFKATLGALIDHDALSFAGASVTIPHKENLTMLALSRGWVNGSVGGSANTYALDAEHPGPATANSDVQAVYALLNARLGEMSAKRVGIVGAGGTARAVATDLATRGATVVLYNRTLERAERLSAEINHDIGSGSPDAGKAVAASLDLLPKACCHAFINCTPVGMSGGPDPDGLSIPVNDITACGEDAVFFDTVYNPIETPMLKAARARGFRTIDGVEMFVRQAAAQFELWTGTPAPTDLFDRLVRQRLGA